MNNGWICPICGRVYSPYTMECISCNQEPRRYEVQPYEWDKWNRQWYYILTDGGTSNGEGE